MANEGIWRLILTTRNEIPAAVEKDIQALNKLEATAKRANSGFGKVVGKAVPGGAVGNALSGALGGGIGATLGVGAAFALFSGIRSLAEESMKADVAAQNAANSIREQYALSAGAVASVNEISLSFVTAGSMLKAALGEVVSTILASARYLGAAGLNLGAGIGRAMGIDMSPTESVIEGILSKFFANAPAFMGGIGGDNSPGLAAAEQRLAKAQLARRERDARIQPAAARSPTAVSVDEYARMGLFIGGRAVASETNQLLRDHQRQLELLNRSVDQLAPRIAENI